MSKRLEVERYLTYQEVADLFRVKVVTVRNWVCDGELKVSYYVRLGKWAKEAMFAETDVALLQIKKYPQLAENMLAYLKCINCGHEYTSPDRSKRVRCPSCEKMGERYVLKPLSRVPIEEL